MKVALIGYEVEGRAAYSYWQKLGADITICDIDPNKQIPQNVSSQLGEQYLDNLDQFDVVVRSAGIHPDVLLKPNPDIGSKITTVINEFLRICPTKHVIGVTGTKGKGTTSTLIARMLEVAGKQVFLGGNIGVPPLDFLDKLTEESWVVLELSSFQLADLRYSPPTAVCLMMAPEHLNWHADMDDYIIAKAHLFEHQQQSDLAIYFGPDDTAQRIAAYSPGLKLPYFRSPGAYVDNNGAITIDNQIVCHTNELKLLGKHNWQNVCAAITVVWQFVQSITEMRTVLMTFTGLEHRLEFVREVDGVAFYNDSYSSVSNATSAALDAIPGPKVIILGGFDRNLPLNPLIDSVQSHAGDIRKAVLVGASAQRVASELSTRGFANVSLEPAKQMDQIVATARSFAKRGDSVILSPGFPSFDMFKNFTDRGLQFKSVVEQL